ncbi:hypothetical protein B0T22DRAFT_537020 [Podospora appendiculata]|uniref:NACHT domain-containing protein n=1 Tax=Podospora appendiculata TaxID=314037 RepID=A0AAE0XDH9_9PEZI|nr:hypothetical protein B0T22DRAFT_537020 [Podospora appendiculata]
MKPLSALSIAATVVQFVDFTIKAILTARKVHKDGSSVDVTAIMKTTEELRSWVAGLTAPQDSAPGVGDDGSKSLKAAYEVFCTTISSAPWKTNNLSSKHRSSWASIYVALNTIYKKEDIEAMAKRLESYRQEISLHLLAVLNAKTDVYSSQLSTCLDSIDTRIVEILTFMQMTRKTVMLSSRKSELGDGEASSLHREPENLMAFTENTLIGLGNPIYVERWASLAAKVLGYLHFRTFGWIFEPPYKDSPWSDFGHWLRERRTHDFLKIWKGSDALVTAQSFLWAPGISLQKSQEGLLRALLHSLLSQCPQLVPSAFPELFNDLLAGKNPEHSLTIAELQVALHMLIESSTGIKFCLFVDGLDEYSGDHFDIVETFSKLALFPYVKIVISSRPWPVFLDAFGAQPRLWLQDLTAGDVIIYISDALNNSQGLREIRAIKPELYPTLVFRICERASGVFLWVRLAVRSILNGLQDADTVSDLYRRIDELPEDLELMYKSSFDGLGSTRNAAARMILMVLGAGEPISLLQLALVDESNPTLETVIDHQISPMPADHLRSMCETMERRIDSRTRGFLEIRGDESFESDVELRGTWSHVEFFHRTAMDFFLEDHMWELLKSLAGASFDLEMALLASCLYELKFLPAMRTIDAHYGYRCTIFRMGLQYTQLLEHWSSKQFSNVLDDMERSIKSHWQAATGCETGPETNIDGSPSKEDKNILYDQEKTPTWAGLLDIQNDFQMLRKNLALDSHLQPFLGLCIS